MNCKWGCVVLAFVFGIVSCKRSSSLRSFPNNSPTISYNTRTHQNLTVRLMIHIDSTLTKRLSKELGPKTRRKLKYLSKQILIDVQNMFRHSSLKQRIHFNLLGVKFLKNNSDLITMDENGSKYLRSYCSWQSVKKYDNWFYSVLITGLDLFYINNKGMEVRRSTGRGYLSGMCSVRHSCTLIEWHPKNIGYLLAHEIAHSLGISHDGSPYNDCTPRGHMMGARYNVRHHPKSWSPCSRRALRKFIASEGSWCLRKECLENRVKCNQQ